MRLFIAVELTPEIKDHLYKLQGKIKGFNLGKLLFVPKKNLHLTLKFLGEIDSKDIDNIKNSLKDISVEQFNLKLDKLSFFMAVTKPTVLFVSINPLESFVNLQKEVDFVTMNHGDLKLGTHITLARIKSLKDKELFMNKIKRLKVDQLSFTVKSFSLVKSIMSKDGSRYETLERYDLD
jgi:2'-5' RNA ligase